MIAIITIAVGWALLAEWRECPWKLGRAFLLLLGAAFIAGLASYYARAM